MAQDLKDTLLLPKTDFPMRAGLPQREPGRVAHWEKLGLYGQIQAKHAGKPAFVLHDGPPFTNGDVHIGTALNKSLKDFVNRYKSMRGFRTPYVPGWDCHGLPIEQKVAKDIKEKNLVLLPPEFRAKCDEFAEGWITKQTDQFKRIGVLADWKNEYKTKAPAYEANILRVVAAFFEQGLVYRWKKPVYYSIPFETALAEAEIEYKDHTSIAIWVKFLVPIDEAKKFGLPTDKPLYIVIWTTTPWTIPANLAIALHPEVDYVVADVGADRLIVAQALLGSVATAAKIEPQPSVVLTLPGAKLEGLQARHPFIDRVSPVVLADYVTTDSGTGAVHTAPGHGADDYLTGLKYGLDIYCPVRGDGKYKDDSDYPERKLPADLIGITTLETVEDLAAKKPSPANLAILRKLAEANALLAKAKYQHSYPHCWRSKTPIIFLATHQWFVGLDKQGTREKALAEITKIAEAGGWIPAWGEARIRGAVSSRPDWCISRNRRWGVPIPAFYHTPKGEVLFDQKDWKKNADFIRKIADKIEAKGTNYWYEASVAELLDGIKPAGWPPTEEIGKEHDTLDVWFDSGSSHVFLRKFLHKEFAQDLDQIPADLYLEGSDQHRGWFQSSLWTSVIAFGAAPYKAVLTHGFIVDKDRQKISKSSTYQKPQTAEAYIAQHGADVIRLWIASQDFRDDIPVDDEILKNVTETYRGFRNTVRFLLSNLFDFDIARDAVPIAQMDVLDRWALHQTAKFIEESTAAYETFEFHKVYQLCRNFYTITLSSIYLDVLKDRLYTLDAAHPRRRSSQTAMHAIFDSLVRVMAPVLSFTTDEAWSHAKTGQEYSNESVHLQDWPLVPTEWKNDDISNDFKTLLFLRSKVNEKLEVERQAGKIGKSLDACAIVYRQSTTPTPDSRLLERYLKVLPELFIVSAVSFEETTNPNLGEIRIQPCSETELNRCPRCWRWVPAFSVTSSGEVCPRCAEALNS